MRAGGGGGVAVEGPGGGIPGGWARCVPSSGSRTRAAAFRQRPAERPRGGQRLVESGWRAAVFVTRSCVRRGHWRWSAGGQPGV